MKDKDAAPVQTKADRGTSGTVVRAEQALGTLRSACGPDVGVMERQASW